MDAVFFKVTFTTTLHRDMKSKDYAGMQLPQSRCKLPKAMTPLPMSHERKEAILCGLSCLFIE